MSAPFGRVPVFAMMISICSLAAGCGVVCFGHSLGGTLALAAELRRPGIFAAMFVYEPVISDGCVPQPALPVNLLIL